MVKKLLFALPFLLTFALFNFAFSQTVKDYTFLFSLDLKTLYLFFYLSGLMVLSSLTFVVFCALSQDIKIILPIGVVAALSPLIFIPYPLSLILAGGSLISMFFVNTLLQAKLKTYVDFQPAMLFAPSVKHLVTLLSLAVSIVYFLSVSTQIQKNGFEIPDSLIESSLNFMSPSLPGQLPDQDVKGVQYLAQGSLPQITPEQLQLLRQNPELLKQYNIDPSMLDLVEQYQKTGTLPSSSGTNTSKSSSKTTSPSSKPGSAQSTIPDLTGALNTGSLAQNPLVKTLVKDQLEKMVEPYKQWIPIGLALLLYLTLSTFNAIFSLFISPLISILFQLMAKSGYLKFTEETRTVKKMVV